MPSTLYTSIPNTTAFAVKVARQWRQVPEAVSDDDAISQGLIDPNMIALILQIIQQVMNCIPNSRPQGFRRIKSFIGSKPLEKLADQMRLNGFVNAWADRLGIPREPGDVVMIREAMAHAAGDLAKEEDFGKMQTEMIWLTI